MADNTRWATGHPRALQMLGWERTWVFWKKAKSLFLLANTRLVMKLEKT